jgi:integrase/recombinase XerD
MLAHRRPVEEAPGMSRVPSKALPSDLVDGRDDFLEALRVEAGLAELSLEAYARDVTRFLAFAARRAARTWRDVDAELVVAWLGERRAQGAAEASVARGLCAVRMCARHLVARGSLARDPLSLVASPVLARLLPGTLSPEEVERLLRAPQGTGWQAQRDRALLELLYASGARVSEAIGLCTDALEPSLSVVCLYGKGGKQRVVPLGARSRDALLAWLGGGRRMLPGAQAARAVFLSKSGRPLDRTTAWRRVGLAARQAGLSARVTPHTLRHSFATHLIECGADLRSVQEMLGHASIRTTEVYAHLDSEHVRSLHRLYHPRG